MEWFELAAQILLLFTIGAMLYFAVMFYRNRPPPRPPGSRTRRTDYEESCDECS